jgi:hypothetical protein
MAWQARYNGSSSDPATALVPGGRLVLLLVGTTAASVIANELLQLLLHGD